MENIDIYGFCQIGYFGSKKTFIKRLKKVNTIYKNSFFDELSSHHIKKNKYLIKEFHSSSRKKPAVLIDGKIFNMYYERKEF